MDHTEYQEQLSLYVDGMLDDHAAADLFAHLSGCGECRSLLNVSMRVRDHLFEQELASVPASLDRRLLGVEPSHAKSAKRSAWYVPLWFTRISIPLPAAASIIFLIIFGSLLFSPLLSQAPTREAEITGPFVEKIPPGLQQMLNHTR